MKGGHIAGTPIVTDILMTQIGRDAPSRAPASKAATPTAPAAPWRPPAPPASSQGLTLERAVARGWGYTAEAIRRAPGFGAGHGPLDHAWPLRGD